MWLAWIITANIAFSRASDIFNKWNCFSMLYRNVQNFKHGKCCATFQTIWFVTPREVSAHIGIHLDRFEGHLLSTQSIHSSGVLKTWYHKEYRARARGRSEVTPAAEGPLLCSTGNNASPRVHSSALVSDASDVSLVRIRVWGQDCT